MTCHQASEIPISLVLALGLDSWPMDRTPHTRVRKGGKMPISQREDILLPHGPLGDDGLFFPTDNKSQLASPLPDYRIVGSITATTNCHHPLEPITSLDLISPFDEQPANELKSRRS